MKDFYWLGMRTQVCDFVHFCGVCHDHKTVTLQSAGLLQLLLVPIHVQSDISIDFVEGLPMSQKKNVILVVVDRFSKYCHLIALAHPYTAVNVTHLFFNNIFK